MQLFHQREYLSSAHGIQPRDRLVEHEDLRLHGDDAGYCRAAFLSAGQLEGAALGELGVRQSHHFHCAANSAVYLVLFELHVFGTESDVFRHRVLEKLIFGILEHHAYGETQALQRLFVGGVHTCDAHLALLHLDKPVEVLYERGFAGARRADEPDELALFHG